MENEMILILVWAIIMTIILGILVVILLNLKKKHDQDIRDKENEIQDVNNKLEQKQTASYKIGVNTTAGDYTQILGEFALLSEYNSIITLSTTSRQPSLDLIGINNESLDFIELKKKGAGSSPNEKQVKRLIEEKKVSYKIFDVELPSNFTMEERKKREQRKSESKPKKRLIKLTREEQFEKKELQKIEAKKIHPTAYEPWTISNDEFLKDYWNDESNKQSENVKIQELCKKLDRSKGGIEARIKKLGLRR
jgi:hypothetical protein